MRSTHQNPFGISAYHLRIENDQKARNLSLFIPEVDCAYELWIEDELVVENGSLKEEHI